MLIFRNDEGDVLTEEELREQFRDYLDEIHPLIELGDVRFNASTVLERLDPIAFRGQFLDYQDEHGWDELGSDETEVTLESWRQARNDARTP